MTILATAIVLSVLIFVHELGHFAAAKAVGMEVRRFSIGLGPKVLGFTKGETEYVVSAVPLGGYVKLAGMEDHAMDGVEAGETGESMRPSGRDYGAQPIWARAVVISAGVIMNMLFAFGVYTFVVAWWGVPEFNTTRVGQVRAETLPSGTERLRNVEPGSRFTRIGGLDVTHWGDVRDAILHSPPGPTTVEFAEPSRRIGIRIPASAEERVSLFRSVAPWVEAGVGVVGPGSPAEEGGLKAGDRLVAVDGEPVSSWFQFVDLIAARPGKRVEVTVSRDRHTLIRAVTLGAEETTRPDGSVAAVGKIGISPPPGGITYQHVSFRTSIALGYRETAVVTGSVLGFLGDILTGAISPRALGSIVTIGEASGQAAAAGLRSLLLFMALFSTQLAIFNLLPIPVLDGGHLLFLTVEAVRGCPLSLEQQVRWDKVGFTVVVGILLWALSNDFLRVLGL